MLMSQDAIADVVEVVRPTDFYKPAHEFIFDAILSLYGRGGHPADAITVADELGRTGQLAKVGGHPYLHDLLASVSIAANAGHYAQIVRDKAILRRLVEASVRIAQMGYAGGGQCLRTGRPRPGRGVRRHRRGRLPRTTRRCRRSWKRPSTRSRPWAPDR